MKRAEVLRKIKKAAKAADLDYTEVEGGRHTKITVGSKSTVVARHNEIADLMAKIIFKQLEEVLGEGWWK